ncbi:MAG: 4Fe-4S dicluster domain-containing protein [Raoultibacter sp.]
MIQIDHERCTSCEKCIDDCPSGNIALTDSHAVIKGDCIKCGHCVAICPVAAVFIPEYTMESVVEYQAETFDIPAETLLNFIKFRRSMRHFQARSVETRKIQSKQDDIPPPAVIGKTFALSSCNNTYKRSEE